MENLRRILTVAACVLSLFAHSQDLNRVGFVIGFGGTTKGDIKVDMDKNIVVVRSNNNISLLHAKSIKKIASFKNNTEEVYYTGSFGMNKPFIFKALADGGLPLLYREGVKFSEYEETVYPPFFILKDGQVYALGATKKEILEVFDGRFQNEMNDFSKKNRIDFKSKEGLTLLFDHYNVITMIASN